MMICTSLTEISPQIGARWCFVVTESGHTTPGLLDAQPRRPLWSDETATCVVMASAGYPGDYSTGKTITGINDAERLDGVVVFHAGTKFNADGEIETTAGRVLGVSARAATLGEAARRAYEAVSKIQFNGMHFRHDIGAAH